MANHPLQRTEGQWRFSARSSHQRGGGAAPAAERERCYDFRCQGLGEDFLRDHLFSCAERYRKRRSQSNATGEPAALRGLAPT